MRTIYHFGIEEHDKRLFGYPDKSLLLDKHPGPLGTFQLGATLERKIANCGRIHIVLGLGLSIQVSTFTRPYDHGFRKKGVVTFDGRTTNLYFQNLLNFNSDYEIEISNKISLLFDVRSQFNFSTIAAKTGVKNSDMCGDLICTLLN